MSDTRYEDCKRFVVRGLLCLAGGSVLLLAFKIPGLPDFWGTLSAYAGGGIVLFGNGYIIYGLLIFAGNQESE